MKLFQSFRSKLLAGSVATSTAIAAFAEDVPGHITEAQKTELVNALQAAATDKLGLAISIAAAVIALTITFYLIKRFTRV